MNRSQLDVLFINADSSLIAYQGLASKFSAIEPPTWSLLLAESCRSKGFSVAILDCTAEDLSHSEAVKRIIEFNPRFALFVVYGQNPNSGTTNMIGNTQCCELLKSSKSSIQTGFVGSHKIIKQPKVRLLNNLSDSFVMTRTKEIPGRFITNYGKTDGHYRVFRLTSRSIRSDNQEMLDA